MVFTGAILPSSFSGFDTVLERSFVSFTLGIRNCPLGHLPPTKSPAKYIPTAHMQNPLATRPPPCNLALIKPPFPLFPHNLAHLGLPPDELSLKDIPVVAPEPAPAVGGALLGLALVFAVLESQGLGLAHP